MSKKTYYARSNISLDGEEYAIGAEVPLTEKQAEQIADAVTTKQPAQADSNVVPLPNKTDIELTQDQVVVAIGQLDTFDPSHWTKSGKPQTDALEALLKGTVSGALRDTAWTELNTLIAEFTESGSKLEKDQLVALSVALGLDYNGDTKEILASRITGYLDA